jgi:hypothetical protein
MKWLTGVPPLMLVLGCGQASDLPTASDTERDQLVEQHVNDLVGKWTAPQDGSAHFFHEEWQLAGTDSLTGTGFVLSGKDTVFIEQLALFRSLDNWTYTARIPSMHDGRTMAFKLTHVDKDSMCFEAPSHDHPERITYFHSSAENWRVSLSGHTTNGPQYSVIDLRSSKPALP